MNVSLTPQLEAFVQQKVASGLYTSASEVIREALRILEEQDRVKATKLEMLRKELQKGIDELDQGEGIPLDMEAIKKEAKARKERKGKIELQRRA
jgi:antitoxin ParD1/3/4